MSRTLVFPETVDLFFGDKGPREIIEVSLWEFGGFGWVVSLFLPWPAMAGLYEFYTSCEILPAVFSAVFF